MRLDLWTPTASPYASPELLAALCEESERRGVATIWVGEHAVMFDEYESRYPYAEDGRMPAGPDNGLLEPLSTLAFMAAHTNDVRLGTAMLLLPQRNPVYTAKETSTIDWLSNGRVDLGVGVGWQREEFEAVAAPWAQRGARTDEYLDVLRALWCDDPSAFDGAFYSLAPCRMHPKPVQQPHPPIHIGGESDAALARAARAGQGWHTFNRRPADLAAPLGRLDELLAAEGRRRRDLRVTVCPYMEALTPERVEQYALAGADAVAALFFAGSAADVPAMFDALQPCFDRAAAC